MDPVGLGQGEGFWAESRIDRELGEKVVPSSVSVVGVQSQLSYGKSHKL